MSFPKILAGITLVVFGVIALAALIKKGSYSQPIDPPSSQQQQTIEISLHHTSEEPLILQEPFQKNTQKSTGAVSVQSIALEVLEDNENNGEKTQQVDRIQEFFNKQGSRLPIVQTITYKSHVPWLKGRPAWIADYASHYK